MTLGMPGGQGKAHFDSGEGQRATRGSVQHLMHQISAGVFAHLKQCVLVIYLTCTPFRWRQGCFQSFHVIQSLQLRRVTAC